MTVRAKCILVSLLLILLVGAVGVRTFVRGCIRKVPELSPFITYRSVFSHTFRMGFANLEQEVYKRPLLVTGKVPEWLSGTLFRNGPALFYQGNKYISNWFDGLAMVHAFTFYKGQVTYGNTFLRTDDYYSFTKTGSLAHGGFLADPCKLRFKELFSFFLPDSLQTPVLPNANVNIVLYTDHLLALTETPLPVEFDPETLETLGGLVYQDKYPKRGIHECVHPHYDPKNGEHIGYLTKFGYQSYYILYRIKNGTIARESIVEIPVDKPSYMHSFSITDRYGVLIAQPLVVNPLDLALVRQGFIKNFVWRPERKTEFIIFERSVGVKENSNKNYEAVKKVYIAVPFFFFHTINAYETDQNSIVLDLIAYPCPAGLLDSYWDILLRPQELSDQEIMPLNTRIIRFTLNLGDKTVESKYIETGQAHIELPRINYSYNGKLYRYFYGVARNTIRRPYVADSLVKVDVLTEKVIPWSEPLCYPGEPVFVPTPLSSKEDDGIILSVVLDARTNSSFLLVLDASTFVERARVLAPYHIPYGIHGNYWPTDILARARRA